MRTTNVIYQNHKQTKPKHVWRRPLGLKAQPVTPPRAPKRAKMRGTVLAAGYMKGGAVSDV